LKFKTGTSIAHIPYKGTAPSLTALIAGEVDMTFANIPAILQHVKGGRLRPLASTGTRRAEMMADVPTMKEAGVSGVEVTVWYGVLAPAATPRDMVAGLSGAVAKAARDPEMRRRLAEQGAEPVGGTAEEFAKILRDEVAKWAEVVKVSGAKAD
jgi:tripartite-type tricarboxylate transporter receptor subunit TctC